jgi:dolichyl-phosphate-mannose-protein mannosyltransferase
VYIAIFWIHFALLPNPGPGDAFMLQNFREKSFIAKTLELNSAMFAASQGLQAEHPYASPAWTWPLMLRPIFYWVNDFGDNTTARIYFLGNPVVWWMSTFGLFAAALFWRPRSRQIALVKWILYAGWIINTSPFLGIERVMFLYHYLPALGFAVAILAGWLGDALTRQRFLQVATVIIAAAAISFIFFAPLSYGLPLSAEQYKMRLWLDSWK